MPLETCRSKKLSLALGSSALRRDLRASTLDGCLHAVMLGLGEIYFPALALLLGASIFEVGLLTTLPMLVGTAFQLLAPSAARRIGQKRWVVGSAALQAATFLPLVLIAAGAPGGYGTLLLCACAYWSLGLGITPVWSAWIGEIVPVRIRSRYFSRRNAAIQATLFLGVLVGGAVVEGGETLLASADLGFFGVFLLAAVSRAASAGQLARYSDTTSRVSSPSEPQKFAWAELTSSTVGRVILLVGLINGGVYVAAAYFTPYMLEHLGLSYLEFTVLTAAIVVARVVSSPYWGQIGRRYGNRRALQVSAGLVVPLAGLWVVSDWFPYLLLLQVLAGFAWAGFDLMTTLNLFDCTREEERAGALTAFNVVNGMAIVLGTLVGGAAFQFLGAEAYLLVFGGSSLLRGVALLAFGGGTGLRRDAQHSFREVFVRVVGLRPGIGVRVRPLALSSGRSRRARKADPVKVVRRAA